MSNMYLVHFNGLPGDRGALTAFLDAHSEIIDWHSSMINSVFILTDLDVVAVRELLRQSPISRFIVVAISSSDFNDRVSGWLPRRTWDFLRRREPAK